MKIDNIKQLEAILKLCRKQGVSDIKVDGIEMHLTPTSGNTKIPSKRGISDHEFPDLPQITPFTPGNITENTQIAETVEIATDELTEEELLFYSARQEPGTEIGTKIGTN